MIFIQFSWNFVDFGDTFNVYFGNATIEDYLYIMYISEKNAIYQYLHYVMYEA